MNPNPLSRYFRQPAIYIRLPSDGRFYPQGTLEPTANNEYPVLPMTTMDEITYRTPDALFNGEAVASVIRSCVPNIQDPWAMPAMDLDTVLIAIRIATYGHEMDIDTQCPACQEERQYGLDLRQVMGSIQAADYITPMKHGDLEIYFQPISYRQINQNNMRQFEDQKMLQIIDDQNLDNDTKAQKLGEILKNITAVTIASIAQSIRTVKTPQATVDNQQHIAEWLGNCDRALFNTVRDHIIDAKQASEIKPLKLKCPACQNEYEQTYTLNMTDFFVPAS